MTAAAPASLSGRLGGPARCGRAMTGLAFAVLLGCLAGRCFVGEMPFRLSSLQEVLQASSAGPAEGSAASRLDLARAVFATVLLAAAALSALGLALSGQGRLARPWWGLMMAAFAAWALGSGLAAADRRSGLLVWAEQAALLSAAFTACQLCRDRRRWDLLAAVLSAAGLALAAKGFYQYFVEAHDRLTNFMAYYQQALAAQGLAPDSPQAKMLQARWADPAPFGYLGLTNPFASLLIVLLGAAAGLSADAFVSARRLRKAHPPGSGEVHLPTLAAMVVAAGSVALAVVLVLTRSRAGLAAAGLGALGAVGTAVWRRRLAPHWRKAVLGAGAAGVLAWAAVAAYGLRHDALPGKSMTYRWFYWTAAARIVAEHPVAGIGGGNFPDAYLQHRRAEAEEAVKTPHNFVLHALAQFGLPGGALFVAVVLAALAMMARPAEPAQAEPSSPGPAGPRPLGPAGACVAAVFASRLVFGQIGFHPLMVLLDGVLPTMAFAGALAVCLWAAGALGRQGPVAGAGLRIALGSAAGAFVVHGLVEFGFWAPGVALAFWAGVGGLVARAQPAAPRPGWSGWVMAAAASGLALAAGLLVLRPEAAKAVHVQRAAELLAAGQYEMAARQAEQAAQADPQDPLAAVDACKFLLGLTPRDAPELGGYLLRAHDWALQAVRRDLEASGSHQWLARSAWYLAVPDAIRYPWWTLPGDPNRAEAAAKERLADRPGDPLGLADLARVAFERGDYPAAASLLVQAADAEANSSMLRAQLGEAFWRAGQADPAHQAWRRAAELAPRGHLAEEALEQMARAVALDPMNHRLRLDDARMLAEAARFDACRQQLAAAEEINHRLLEFGRRYPPPSTQRFTDRELEEIRTLHARCEAGR